MKCCVALSRAAPRRSQGVALILLFLTITVIRADAAGARLYKSGPIQITADGLWVWAANQDNDSVTRLSTATDAAIEVPLPDPATQDAPRGLTLREDGSEVWVACHDSDRVYVLSGVDGSPLERIDLPWGSGPAFIAISRDQTLALVTLHRSAAVAVLDVAQRTVTRILEPLYLSPYGIAWTEDGHTAIVTHLFAEEEHPFLSRIDVSDGNPRVRTRITVFATDPRHSSTLSAPYNIAEGGYLTTRGHPGQIPGVTGRNEVWLPTQYNNITEDVYTPDSTVQSTVRHVDLDTMTLPNGVNDKVVLTALHAHDPAGSNPYLGPGWDAHVAGPIDIGFSADGTATYVLHELSNDLLVMPSNTPLVKPAGAAALVEIPVGDRPTGMALSPVTNRAYVYNQLSRDISVVDLAMRQEVARIASTPATGEPFPPAFLQGARLFHTSDDPRISAKSKVSCASCHINAEVDGRNWAFHRLPGAHGPREVPTLLGLNRTFGPVDPATGLGQLHRSGDRDEVQDFEHTFQGINMGGTGFLGTNVQAELGPPNAGRDADLDALALYTLNLDPLRRSPYRIPGGGVSEAAIRGATFFMGTNRPTRTADAGCAVCHVPETGFVDFQFHDVGSRRPAAEEELNTRAPLWHVNTPTLLGLWVTPPYVGTSGFALTILDVLTDAAQRVNQGNRHGTPDGLTARQMRDLEAFVLSIDGDLDGATVRNARDVTPPRVVRVSPTSLTRLDVWFSESVEASSAADTLNWRLQVEGGGTIPITGVALDTQNGDRMALMTSLSPQTRYRLAPAGPISDLAATASGGVKNEINLDDPANTHVIVIGTNLTITLGASGYENLSIRVHDTAMVGPNLSTWSHDSVWLFPVNSGPRVNTGFVRFNWRDAFMQATGVTDAGDILEARISLEGELGDAQMLELRRVLQPWSDPLTGGDWNSNAGGAPTWRDHAHPNGRWNLSGAGRLGSFGDAVADYDGVNDLASRVDASVMVETVNETVWCASPLLTDAYRFWFDHPAVDYGHAFRLQASSTQALKFERGERRLQAHAPVLTLTYALASQPVLGVPEVQGDRSVRFNLQGEMGTVYRVDVSDNATSWQMLTRVTATNSVVVIMDDAKVDVSAPQFYRAVRE